MFVRGYGLRIGVGGDTVLCYGNKGRSYGVPRRRCLEAMPLKAPVVRGYEFETRSKLRFKAMADASLAQEHGKTNTEWVSKASGGSRFPANVNNNGGHSHLSFPFSLSLFLPFSSIPSTLSPPSLLSGEH